MKTVHHFNTARDKLLHIETEGGIINIRVGLQNTEGQEVTSIEILADESDGWKNFDGTVNNRIIKIKKEA